jgi:hypothetical protein
MTEPIQTPQFTASVLVILSGTACKPMHKLALGALNSDSRTYILLQPHALRMICIICRATSSSALLDWSCLWRLNLESISRFCSYHRRSLPWSNCDHGMQSCKRLRFSLNSSCNKLNFITFTQYTINCSIIQRANSSQR